MRAKEHYRLSRSGKMVNVKVETIDGVVICQPVGELDAASVAAFRSALAEVVTKGDLVMAEVPFMDSAGLGALIGGIRRTREAGGEVALSCNRPTLIRLLETTGFDRIVSVTRDRASAVATLAAARS